MSDVDDLIFRSVRVDIHALIGETFTEISTDEYCVKFITDEGIKYLMAHEQTCCEDVNLQEIHGCTEWLVGSPILKVEVKTNEENQLDKHDESFLWTFYELSTIQGSVTFRWYGTSNGYYSEEVDVFKVRTKDE